MSTEGVKTTAPLLTDEVAAGFRDFVGVGMAGLFQSIYDWLLRLFWYVFLLHR